MRCDFRRLRRFTALLTMVGSALFFSSMLSNSSVARAGDEPKVVSGQEAEVISGPGDYAGTAGLRSRLQGGAAHLGHGHAAPVIHGHGVSGRYPYGAGAGIGSRLHGQITDDASCRPYYYGQPDLFYNYFAGSNCSPQGAQLYVSPGPIPQHVGHTYITYQPLMPHEFMYPHHRTYHREYDDGRGFTRASVHWYAPPFKGTVSHVHQFLRIPR
ncbi:MAG: hypothetical protein ACKOBW_12580 [Planctomycetota bacterium]